MLNNAKSFLSSLLICVSLLNANTAANAQAIDGQLLLKQRLKQLNAFEASFSQVVTDRQNTILQEASGKIALQYPNKLYWQLDEPNENILVADGQTLWQLDPFMEQVVAVDQSQAIDNNPLILLTNPNGAEWQQFNVSEKNNQFSITPKELSGEVAQLILSFDNEKLVAMKIIDGQQQVSALTFSKIKQNKKIDKQLFVFKIPEGFEFDDQRAP